MEKIKNYSLRVDEKLLEKFHYIAKSEGRSVNAQLLIYMRRSVEQYERKYGEICIDTNK